MAQWLERHIYTEQGTDSIPGQGTKIPQAAQRSKKKKKREREKDRGSRNKELIPGQKANQLLRGYFSLACGRGQYQADYLTSVGHAIPD